MDFDDQLRRHFGTTDIASLPQEAIDTGTERMLVEFGLETDRNRRFGLWTLMYILGVAPDLDVAFAEASDREAARDFMDLIAASQEES